MCRSTLCPRGCTFESKPVDSDDAAWTDPDVVRAWYEETGGLMEACSSDADVAAMFRTRSHECRHRLPYAVGAILWQGLNDLQLQLSEIRATSVSVVGLDCDSHLLKLALRSRE